MQDPLKSKEISNPEANNDGVDRRGFLECMAWAGTGVLWMMTGGILKSYGMSQMIDKTTGGLKKGLIIPASDFSFVQISDSHIGFNKPANPDVTGTLQAAIDKINRMAAAPSFVLPTGDLTHLAQADEFDTLEQSLKSVKTEKIFYVPGEHDMTDNGKLYMERFGKGTKGDGWYSFDSHGVHFIGLNNVTNHVDGGLGYIGADQLKWMENDLKGAFGEHADRGICAYSVVGGLSAMGLGDAGQRGGVGLFETFWVRLGIKWSYPSDHPKSGRQYYLSYGLQHCLPATCAGERAFARADEGAGGEAEECAWADDGELY